MSFNQVVCMGQRQKNLYKLDIVYKSHQQAMTVRTKFDIEKSYNQTKFDINVWHYRMGHIGEQHLKLMSKYHMAEGLFNTSTEINILSKLPSWEATMH